MTNLKVKKNFFIKIPKTIDIIYCKKRNIILFKGFLKTKSLKVKNKIFLIPSENLIGVSHFLINNNYSCIELKQAKIMQKTIISKIKDILIEINYNLYRKVNFVGVGYRAFNVDNLNNQFYFKLGYSHLIYFNIPKPLKAFCIKFTKLFLFGNVSNEQITKVTSLLRQCKKPEPYKGKGILYENERIKLKKGKKI